MRYTLIGIDPGVVDTGLVVLRFDGVYRTWSYRNRVWSDVTYQDGHSIGVDGNFLSELRDEVDNQGERGTVFRTFIEGYRPRGRNMRQDQEMTLVVQEIRKALRGSIVIDNTGIQKIVKRSTLDLFPMLMQRTNHADLWSAARVALAGAIKDDQINHVIARYVHDALTGNPWELQ